jgi:thiamine-monophosphate kinase
MTHETGFPELIQKFKEPTARFDAAQILAAHGVKCVMDISDGLAGDAGHIAAASQASIEFKPNAFKVALALAAYCQKYNLDPHLIMLSGGEDYELLFACRPEIFEKIRAHLPEAFCVGRIVPYEGRLFINLPDGIRSYQHGTKK